jgi:hypothetical protein
MIERSPHENVQRAIVALGENVHADLSPGAAS